MNKYEQEKVRKHIFPEYISKQINRNVPRDTAKYRNRNWCNESFLYEQIYDEAAKGGTASQHALDELNEQIDKGEYPIPLELMDRIQKYQELIGIQFLHDYQNDILY